MDEDTGPALEPAAAAPLRPEREDPRAWPDEREGPVPACEGGRRPEAVWPRTEGTEGTAAEDEAAAEAGGAVLPSEKEAGNDGRLVGRVGEDVRAAVVVVTGEVYSSVEPMGGERGGAEVRPRAAAMEPKEGGGERAAVVRVADAADGDDGPDEPIEAGAVGDVAVAAASVATATAAVGLVTPLALTTVSVILVVVLLGICPLKKNAPELRGDVAIIDAADGDMMSNLLTLTSGDQIVWSEPEAARDNEAARAAAAEAADAAAAAASATAASASTPTESGTAVA